MIQTLENLFFVAVLVPRILLTSLFLNIFLSETNCHNSQIISLLYLNTDHIFSVSGLPVGMKSMACLESGSVRYQKTANNYLK